MINRTTPWLGALLVLLLAPACAPTEEATDSTGGEAIQGTGAAYYRFRPDFRRCVSPLCGGVWVSRVNHATTRCADGSSRAECYVADVDYTALGLSDRALPAVEGAATSGRAVVRGRVESRVFGSFGSLGHFVATEAWQAATDAAPTGTFFHAENNGIECFRAPCPSYTEASLNGTAHANVDGVDLAHIAGITPADVTKGQDTLDHPPPGILVAGVNHTAAPSGPASSATTLVASQYYLRVSPGVSDATFCDTDADCTMTVYAHAVTSAADCYCTICPSTPLNVSTEATYQHEWTRYCAGGHRICPAIRCIAPPTPSCLNHACVAPARAP